jgi:hypothetical protein
MQLTTNDSYEVAWYLYHYGKVLWISKRKVQDNKVLKKGYKIEYSFDVDVADKYVELYKTGKAYGNVNGLKNARLKIKKLIRELSTES